MKKKIVTGLLISSFLGTTLVATSHLGVETTYALITPKEKQNFLNQTKEIKQQILETNQKLENFTKAIKEYNLPTQDIINIFKNTPQAKEIQELQNIQNYFSNIDCLLLQEQEMIQKLNSLASLKLELNSDSLKEYKDYLKDVQKYMTDICEFIENEQNHNTLMSNLDDFSKLLKEILNKTNEIKQAEEQKHNSASVFSSNFIGKGAILPSSPAKGNTPALSFTKSLTPLGKGFSNAFPSKTSGTPAKGVYSSSRQNKFILDVNTLLKNEELQQKFQAFLPIKERLTELKEKFQRLSVSENASNFVNKIDDVKHSFQTTDDTKLRLIVNKIYEGFDNVNNSSQIIEQLKLISVTYLAGIDNQKKNELVSRVFETMKQSNHSNYVNFVLDLFNTSDEDCKIKSVLQAYSVPEDYKINGEISFKDVLADNEHFKQSLKKWL
ncbi:MAG: hypothetical protein LBT69_04070 [Lactobacillales bacterium]|jgi:hypothetical protein|nr:hypothetical protein [Lactobacillales bacterium]